MAFFPLFINLKNKKIIVIGAGNIARRRIKVLNGFCSCIEVISPLADEEFQNYMTENNIIWHRKYYEVTDIDNAYIVLAATDSSATNSKIATDCRALKIPVNNCSNKLDCDFYFPGVIQTDNITVGVTASGNNHKLSKKVTDDIKKYLERGDTNDYET